MPAVPPWSCRAGENGWTPLAGACTVCAVSVDPAWPYLVRPVGEGEGGAALDAVWRAFGWPPRTQDAAEIIAGRGIEVDRTLVVIDTGDDEIVGTASMYSLQMTVPGGALVAVAGVHLVTVAPTHRRREVATAMMHRQLGDLAATGEATAALWTTEAGIYARYGYGLAAWRQRIEVDLARARFTPRATALVAASPARLRQVSAADAAPHLVAVHAGVLSSRPGMLARTARRWEQLLGGEDGQGAPEVVIASGPDGPTGYALYRVREGAPDLVPSGEVVVQEVSAIDPATHAQLWRHLLDLDLMTTLSCGSRPLPDPLAHLLADHRRMHARVDDALWVRIVDLPRALGQRAFTRPVDVVLEISDEVLPANAGRWRVTVDAAGQSATAARTDDEPDLSMDVADLGAAHLGATALCDLAAAGRVVEHTPGALAAATAAWSHSPSAACPEIF